MVNFTDVNARDLEHKLRIAQANQYRWLRPAPCRAQRRTWLASIAGTLGARLADTRRWRRSPGDQALAQR